MLLQVICIILCITVCYGDTTMPLNEVRNNSNLSKFEAIASFEKFKIQFNKVYRDVEETERRLRIFRANLKKIQALNREEQGTAVYGVTEFSDLSKSEFQKYYTGLKVPAQQTNDTGKVLKSVPLKDVILPSDYDWRNYKVVTPVKNQGMCGSCWAFSVTGNVEGQFAIAHGRLISLSEQELLDCDKVDQGCAGGYMSDAYRAIEKLGGLEAESDYPYEQINDKCQFNKSKVEVIIQDYKNISSDEAVMAQWLFQNGPISIALNANAMQFYFGGVSHPPKFLCSPKSLDHGVLIVGFGIHKTKFTKKLLPYWLIKNSWGSSWGEHGYYRLYRGAGVCGVNLMASSAVVK